MKTDLDEFVYAVSHDLQAPVRAISGFTEILLTELGGQQPAGVSHAARVIQQNTELLSTQIEGIVRLYRAQNEPLHLQRCDQAVLVAEVVAQFVQEQQCAMDEVEVGPLPVLRCDREAIKTVWWELISNAIKFSSKADRRQVKIQSQTMDSVCHFIVSDNGVGFDPAERNRVFQLFQRLHSRAEFPGSGSGLALARRIVELHGGEMTASAALGRGAVIQFSLPL